MSNKNITPGIPDDEFIRGQVPMTKEEIRTLSIAKLRLQPGDRFLDIGAGTGSVSIEAALLLPEQTVYAVEHNPEAVSLIGQNCEKFSVNNIKVIAGAQTKQRRGLISVFGMPARLGNSGCR